MFCYHCAKPTTGVNPPVCPDHGELWPLARNAPCADAVVRHEGRVLLGLRNIEPNKNMWSLPGGHQNLGEHPEMTAKRETYEEFGLLVSIDRLLGVTFEKISDTDYRQIIVYEASPISPPDMLEISDEFVDGGWFYWDTLSNYPKPLTSHTLECLFLAL